MSKFAQRRKDAKADYHKELSCISVEESVAAMLPNYESWFSSCCEHDGHWSITLRANCNTGFTLEQIARILDALESAIIPGDHIIDRGHTASVWMPQEINYSVGKPNSEHEGCSELEMRITGSRTRKPDCTVNVWLLVEGRHIEVLMGLQTTPDQGVEAQYNTGYPSVYRVTPPHYASGLCLYKDRGGSGTYDGYSYWPDLAAWRAAIAGFLPNPTPA